MLIVVAVIRHAAACAAQGKGRANDRGKADVFQHIHRFFQTCVEVKRTVFALWRGDNLCLWVFDAKAIHGFAEELAVFGHFNCVAFRTDQLNVEFLQNAQIIERQRSVQTGLTAHRWQERIRALFFDDFCNSIRRDRFDIGRIREARIGHDRRRIGVHQDDAVALFAQRFTCLCAGVVKFAGLTNNDWPCTNDHNRRNIGSLWHGTPRMFEQQRGISERDARKLSWVIDKRHAGSSGFRTKAGLF